MLLEISSFIEKGSKAFLWAEYQYIGVFTILMSFVIFFAVENELGEFWTTFAFIIGALTSLLAGYIGMMVAVYSNCRCTFEA